MLRSAVGADLSFARTSSRGLRNVPSAKGHGSRSRCFLWWRKRRRQGDRATLLRLRRVLPNLQVVLEAAGYAVAPGLVADVAAGFADEFFYQRDGIIWANRAGRVVAGKHRYVVEVVAGREDLLAFDRELARDFREGGAFVVANVAEA